MTTGESARAPSRIGWRAFALLGAVAAAVLLFGFRREFIAADLEDLYWLSAAVAVAAVTVIGAAGRLRLWSSGFLFAVVLAAFHLGIPIVRLLGVSIDWQTRVYTDSWFRDDPQIGLALWLCVTALVAFAVGYLLTSLKPDSSEPTVRDCDRLRSTFAVPGLIMVAVGAAMYLGYAAAVAPELFLGAGKDVYEATIAASNPVGWGTMLTSVGIIIAAAAPPSRARTWAMWIFAVFAVFTLIMGSRTAALYAIVAVVVAVARVRKMPSARTAILLIVSGLLVVSTVEQVRTLDWGQATIGDFLGSPVAGLQEMGASLRPVVETVGVLENGSTDLRYGETYIVTPIRAVETVLGVGHDVTDERWADTAIADRTPGFNIGYSTVAEAYLNFGGLGAFLAFIVLGAAFGLWDNRRLGDPVTAARVAIVFVALAATVRQTSNVVLVTVVFGLLAVEVARWWPARRRPAPTSKWATSDYQRLLARDRQ